MESINGTEYLTTTVENVTIASVSFPERHNPWGAKRDPLFIVVPMTVLYSLIFLTGVIGNVSTCIVIARNRHMHTATNYYLFSLAISDLLLLISGLPQEMYQLWSKYPYVFGQELCLLLGLAAETSSNATVLTITAFTVERYVAICHPFFSHTLSKLSRAIKFVVAIWIVAILCAMPQAMQFGLIYAVDKRGNLIDPDEFNMCGLKEHYPYSFEVSTFLFFFAPMTVITILYILIGVRLRKTTSKKADQRIRDSRRSHQPRSTTRVVKMLVVVVVAFFICWAPFQTQRLYALYFSSGGNTSPTTILIYKLITYASGLLYYLSTTINPFLYNIMSLKFREAFKNTLTKCLNGREVLQSEGGGGSSGGIVPGGVFPRFNYSVLSHRSARNNNNSTNNSNNNNSCSSSNSYIDPLDLNRRPLVVSFRKKNTRTSTSSLEFRSPEKRELLQISKTDAFIQLPKSPGTQKRVGIIKSVSPKNSPIHIKNYKQNGMQKVIKIEDIEIFQESQLRIQKKQAKKRKEKEIENLSCSLNSDEKQSSSTEDNDFDINFVKKSFTVPCLMMN